MQRKTWLGRCHRQLYTALLATGVLWVSGCDRTSLPVSTTPATPASDATSPKADTRVAETPGTGSVEAATPSGPAGFHGFGPAKFGDAEESVRMAWGKPFKDEAAPSESCRYLMPETPGADIAFMVVDGKFARYDVRGPGYVAVGGGKVGDQAQDLLRRYAGRVEQLAHKYVEGGHYLVVTPEDGNAARLIFETDATGKVTEWRVGLPPEVYLVEGCA